MFAIYRKASIIEHRECLQRDPTELIRYTNSRFNSDFAMLNSCPWGSRVLSSVPEREASSGVEENFPVSGFGPACNEPLEHLESWADFAVG